MICIGTLSSEEWGCFESAAVGEDSLASTDGAPLLGEPTGQGTMRNLGLVEAMIEYASRRPCSTTIHTLN